MNIETEIIDSEQPESNFIPSMNVNNNVAQVPEKENIIKDEVLLKLYDEVLDDLRDDRKEVGELLVNVIDMIMNGGDATNSTKEAMVNLIKIKTDIADKKSKIADLMTRMKSKDSFPRYLAANQNNNIKIETTDKKKRRDLIKIIEAAKENN